MLTEKKSKRGRVTGGRVLGARRACSGPEAFPEACWHGKMLYQEKSMQVVIEWEACIGTCSA